MQSPESSRKPTEQQQHQQQGTQQQDQSGKQKDRQNHNQQGQQGQGQQGQGQSQQSQQSQHPSDAPRQQELGLQQSQRQPDAPTPGTPSVGQKHDDPVQGEGDYRADRRYVESVREFVEAGKVDAAARKAEPQSQQEADDMRRAEQEGASHAKDGKQPLSGNPGAAPRE